MKTNFHSKWAWLSKVVGVVAGISALVLVAPAAQAQVLVTGFYNQVGADFFYNFQVENQGGLDVLFVDVIIPGGGAISIADEMAPAGFMINVDTITGRIGFVADSSTFLPTSSVTGFTLTSSSILPDSDVEVVDINGPAPNGTFTSVVTTVPEPGTLPLVALAVSAFAGTVIVRRRRVA